jgi:hypothetical protein
MNKNPCIKGKHEGEPVLMADNLCMLCYKAEWQKAKILPNFIKTNLELNKILKDKEIWVRVNKPKEIKGNADPRIIHRWSTVTVDNAVQLAAGDDPVKSLLWLDINCLEFLARSPKDFSFKIPEFISVENFLKGEF